MHLADALLVVSLSRESYFSVSLVCFKGIRPPGQDASSDHTEAADLAFQWKKKLKRQRAIEVLTASRDQLGLRRREKNSSTPSLVDIVHV